MPQSGLLFHRQSRFQLYNAYTLYYLSFRKDATWQVPCLSLVFATLGTGNIITVSGSSVFLNKCLIDMSLSIQTSWTIPSKMKERKMGLLQLRFTRLDKLFWRHKKRGNSETEAKHSLPRQANSTDSISSLDEESSASNSKKDA